ncbi:MAG TPA: DUF423 domain-containing protein [Bacteroidota bacterium]|nr:DUF423 domain-containing protein [Bacteroidota bacterium]
MSLSEEKLFRVFRWCVAVGACCAGASVGFGAFGAHSLRSVLSSEMFAVFETGVRYQFYHAFGLILCGLAGLKGGNFRPLWLLASAGLFAAGIVLFSGSLYTMSLSGIRAVGALTPLGGLAFITGWVAFAGACVLQKKSL